MGECPPDSPQHQHFPAKKRSRSWNPTIVESNSYAGQDHFTTLFFVIHFVIPRACMRVLLHQFFAFMRVDHSVESTRLLLDDKQQHATTHAGPSHRFLPKSNPSASSLAIRFFCCPRIWVAGVQPLPVLPLPADPPAQLRVGFVLGRHPARRQCPCSSL